VVTASASLLRIDAHQHFWRASRADYPWMPADGPLTKDYLPEDLRALNAAARIAGSVLVQASPTVNETEYLLGMAEAAPEILGVVGWCDLEDRSSADLERLAGNPKLVGIRPMIQDIEDDAWITRDAVIRGLKHSASLGLTFDLLCYPRHLGYAFDVLREIPELPVVINHLAKPDYSHIDEDWVTGMAALAELPNTYSKIAGLVSEAGPGWRSVDFHRHLDTVYELFGPSRLMIGTDWPVSRVVASHEDVVALYDTLISELSVAEKSDLWAGTANRFYGLGHEVCALGNVVR